MPSFPKALALTVILISLFWLYGRSHFYRDPGSIFYDSDRALERRYSSYRQQEAVAFRNAAFFKIQNGKFTASYLLNHTNEKSSICAVVITVARTVDSGRHPLELLITSALAGLYQVERDDLDLRVYFANTDPSVHPLWKDQLLLKLVNRAVAAEEAVASSDFQLLRELEKEGKLGHKTGLDFSYALQYCYDTSSSPFIAIFEGDIIFADGWLARARLGLQDIAERTHGTKRPWLDMRLFNEERSIGWASTNILGNNVPLIIFGLATGLFSIHALIRRYTGKSLSYQTVFVICCVSIPAFVILFYQAGKSSLLPPTPGIKVQNWGCCTQGLILPRERVPDLVLELQRRAPEAAADIIIIDYAQSQNLLRYALDPVQLQHMGFNSVLSPDRSKDEAVWSVAFEDLDPVKLRKEHREMVSNVYGKNVSDFYLDIPLT